MLARRRSPSVVLLTALALSATLILAPSGSTATTPPRVGVSSVQYDSPGAVVPAVVTVYDLPADRAVSIAATGMDGGTATCVGDVWRNPVRNTAGRLCYLTLPQRAGTYRLLGRAHLTAGSRTVMIAGVLGRPVTADGVTSTAPMSTDTVRRIERCGNTTDDVRLTFDDGGSTAQVTSILATLKRNNVKASFFFRGDWARRDGNDALMRQIRADGHGIGNHTSTHPALSRMGKDTIGKQIDGGTAATGTPKLLRPPFGAGSFTTSLQNHAAGKGYELCRWTTDTYDWDGSSIATMVERIKYGDHRSPPVAAGGVVLMHAHGKYTAPGLQQIIDAVRAEGLTLERLR
jgi:peptidoglycan/xylan/chitin deacetylase (PgdA/CDA1 family)